MLFVIYLSNDAGIGTYSETSLVVVFSDIFRLRLRLHDMFPSVELIVSVESCICVLVLRRIRKT